MGWHDGHPIWDSRLEEPVRLTTPFYVESRGQAMDVSIKKAAAGAPTIPVEYSFDKITWQSLGSTSETTALTINVPAGDRVWLRASVPQWASEPYFDYNYNYIVTSSTCNVGGNIMSLLYGSNFTGQLQFPSTSTTYIFYGLFRNGTSGVGKIVDASKLLLPATTLTEYCYRGMFYNCTSLTSTPELPATALANGCYEGMFEGCSSLTTAPTLPATTLANSCYSGMFRSCTSLTKASTLPATILAESCYSSMFNGCIRLAKAPALPATTLADYCYNYMFSGCTQLGTAPTLPATTLTHSCYSGMFSGCTRLLYAPVLPATTLVLYCYSNMFNGCTRLGYIKCLAKDMSAPNCLANWVSGVASIGTFTKKTGASWTTGASGIPSGWTVVEV